MKPSLIYFLKQLGIVVLFVFGYAAIIWAVYDLKVNNLIVLMLFVLSIMITALWNVLKSAG